MKTNLKAYLAIILIAIASNKCRILALGGGGTKGAFQAGAIEGFLKALPPEERIYDYITGVSVGALNMVILAQSQPGNELSAVEHLKELWYNIKAENIFINWPNGFIDGLFFKHGAFDSSPEKALINGLLYGTEFKRKFQFAVTDMSEGSVKYYDEKVPKAKIVDYLLATSAFPGALPYQNLDGTQFSDGGCILNVNVMGAMNRCLKDGFMEDDIIVDMIVTNQKKPIYSNMSDAVAYQMVLRYFSINSYLKTWHDIYDAVVAYPEAHFRYIISPTKSLPEYPIVPLNFNSADILKMYQIGLEDGANIVKKSLSNFKESMEEYRKIVTQMKYGDAFPVDR
jgi:predicted patatin/cPLA2 family phospholipase